MLEAIKAGNITAAHDVSDGGLAVTLAEMAIFGNKGAKLTLENITGPTLELLFSEAQSGVAITVESEKLPETLSHFEKAGVPTHVLGTVSGGELFIDGIGSLSVSEMKEVYESVIPNAMKS